MTGWPDASSPPRAGHGRAAWACGPRGLRIARATLLRHVTSPDGVRLASQVEGEGTPLVMVHGAGSGRWSFDLVRPHLHDRFEVWALDRRGRGDSDDGHEYSIEREFDDVAAVVREAGPGALLFGHSYGGLVAAGAAERLGGVPRLAIYEGPMGGVLADEPWTASFEQRVESGERRRRDARLHERRRRLHRRRDRRHAGHAGVAGPPRRVADRPA